MAHAKSIATLPWQDISAQRRTMPSPPSRICLTLLLLSLIPNPCAMAWTMPQHSSKTQDLSMAIKLPSAPVLTQRFPRWSIFQRPNKSRQHRSPPSPPQPQDSAYSRSHTTSIKAPFSAWSDISSSTDDAASCVPWTSSIRPSSADAAAEDLTYMEFYKWQWQFMTDNLVGLQEESCVSKTGRDMSYVEKSPSDTSSSSSSSMRMHTSCFSSRDYKLIRLTSVDGGADQLQVFTSLWYPRGDAPVLGIDLLQFGKHKHLCVCDFQPVSDTHGDAFEVGLKPVRDRYPSLQGSMTNRFYGPEDSYFSKQMLLGRHQGSDASSDGRSAQDMIQKDLFPAFQEYVQHHANIARAANTDLHANSATSTATTLVADIERNHAAYDTYSAARDPAHALLGRAFGEEWADEYVYDILFPQAERPSPDKIGDSCNENK